MRKNKKDVSPTHGTKDIFRDTTQIDGKAALFISP